MVVRGILVCNLLYWEYGMLIVWFSILRFENFGGFWSLKEVKIVNGFWDLMSKDLEICYSCIG